MKIYTRAGDAGETGLFGGSRVRKDDARVEAYGTVDELNCALGVVRATLPLESPLDPLLAHVQSELFDLGAELATPPARLETKLGARVPLATDERTAVSGRNDVGSRLEARAESADLAIGRHPIQPVRVIGDQEPPIRCHRHPACVARLDLIVVRDL